MKKLILLFATLVCFQVRADGLMLSGRIVGVTDGDTVTVLDAENHQHEIRLASIDAPETSCHARRPSVRDQLCVEQSQPFGHAAKKHLSDLVYGRNVTVALQQISNGNADRSYDREIGTILIDGVDANLEQVKASYAWHYLKYARKNQTDDAFNQYEAAQEQAQQNRLGLWQDRHPTPPWEYRYNKRN